VPVRLLVRYYCDVCTPRHAMRTPTRYRFKPANEYASSSSSSLSETSAHYASTARAAKCVRACESRNLDVGTWCVEDYKFLGKRLVTLASV
jgi:hypothetical protein